MGVPVLFVVNDVSCMSVSLNELEVVVPIVMSVIPGKSIAVYLDSALSGRILCSHILPGICFCGNGLDAGLI